MRLVNKLLLAISLFSFIFLGTSLAEDFKSFCGEVNTDNINIRCDATINSEVICKVNKGESTEVVSEFYEWYKIRLPKDAPSFIKKDLVTIIEKEGTQSPGLISPVEDIAQEKQIAKVIKENVNIRLSPSESAAIIGKVNKNELVNILKDEGKWYKITPPSNSFGWVHKKFINKKSPLIKTEQLPESKLTESTKTSQDKISFIGIIEPYGKIFKRRGTHKFLTEDNKVFLLKGDKKILDNLNYRKVKITGRLIDTFRKEMPVIEIESLEIYE
jgi:uncharacterized protein YgiM (DUF1202 family)